MINDEIQELLDGTLGDDRSAELLHLLSVNPERRADFHRHIALRETMQRDRAGSALDASEDAEIWGALAGLGAATVATGARTGSFGWIARGAAVVAAGVVGYLLGSNSSTSVATDLHPAGGAAVTTQRQTPGTQPTTMIPSPALAERQAADPAARSEATPSPERALAAAPQVIYRDRIVYRYAPSIAAPSSSADIQPPLRADAPIALNNGGRTSTTSNGSEGTTVEPNSNSAPTTSTPSSSLPRTRTDGAVTENGAMAAIDPNHLLDDGARLRSSTQPDQPDAAQADEAFLRDGFEVGLSDHEGMIAPAPKGEESDPTFSNRHINLSYRIMDGRFGLGARFGYGSFAMVTLGSDLRARNNARGELASVETNLYPVLRPQKQFLTEFFMNYRLPVGGRFALGLESSLGVSAQHTKAGGDASLLWFFNKHIGMHAGAGLGYYWYDLTAQNEETLRNSPDNTSVVEMSDAYRGTVLEFKYGIFYHF